MIPPNDAAARNTSLYRRATYVWNHKEFEDWGDAVDQLGPADGIGHLTWRDVMKKQRDQEQGTFGGVVGKGGSGVIIFMLRVWIADNIRRLKLHEK